MNFPCVTEIAGPVPVEFRPLIYAGRSGDDANHRLRIAVLMTSFNRREKTLAALTALAASKGLEDVELHGILVDDASTDGTGGAVGQTFPWVQVLHGDGKLFWCRGMHKAFAAALEGNFDYFFWLNDDTMLYPEALSRLLACASECRWRGGKASIVVGSTVDEHSGALTYGGERRAKWWKPITFVRVVPGEQAQACESMNGNLVLIPAEVAQRVGNLEAAFEHAMGDTDYALRARCQGFDIRVAPGVHGTCGHNSISGTYMDKSLPFSRRWRQMLSRKGLPWRSWLILTRRHAGPAWPLYFALPYVKLMASGIRQSLRPNTLRNGDVRS